MYFESNAGWRQPVSFDWYSCTPEISRDDLIALFLRDHPHCHVEPGRGRLGYVSSDLLCDQSGSVLLTVYHSGGSDCHVQATGSSAQLVAPWLRSTVPHLLSRCDLALDYLEADFDNMTSIFLAAALSHGVKSRYIGPPPSQGDFDSPRTIYLGSRSSTGMFRFYEKGKQMKDPDRLGWVRVEYEFKPQNKDARAYFSTCSLAEIASTTTISRAVFGLLAVRPELAPVPAGPVPSDPEWERTLRHLKKQYGPSFQRLLHDVDFDPVAFVNFLVE